MKPTALKAFVAVAGAFAGYYLFFLCSVFYELYGPSARCCGTAQVWALQGAALILAPMAPLGATALWCVGKQKPLLGTLFPKLGMVSSIVLLLFALVNLPVFLPVS